MIDHDNIPTVRKLQTFIDGKRDSFHGMEPRMPRLHKESVRGRDNIKGNI